MSHSDNNRCAQRLCRLPVGLACLAPPCLVPLRALWGLPLALPAVSFSASFPGALNCPSSKSPF